MSAREYEWLGTGGRVELSPSTERNDEGCAVVRGAIEQSLINDQTSCLASINTGRHDLNDLAVVERAVNTVRRQRHERVAAVTYLDQQQSC